MSPGIYIYPFETELPANLPTSCEGKYGFIRYLASANIIRASAATQTQTIAFTVIKPHNLNALPVVQVRRPHASHLLRAYLEIDRLAAAQVF